MRARPTVQPSRLLLSSTVLLRPLPRARLHQVSETWVVHQKTWLQPLRRSDVCVNHVPVLCVARGASSGSGMLGRPALTTEALNTMAADLMRAELMGDDVRRGEGVLDNKEKGEGKGSG